MSAKQDAIDVRLAELLPTCAYFQESYLENFKQYFQGLATHATLPDGDTAAPVDFDIHPNDQSHDYEDFWRRIHLTEPDDEGERTEVHEHPESALAGVRDLKVRIRFNVSEGPNGWAWAMVLDYEDDDGHFIKTVFKDGTVEDWQILSED